MSTTVTIVGNLTRDPELRFTPGGDAVANLAVAVNRRWMNNTTQQWEEDTSFFDVTCWRTLAENVGHSLEKGHRVVVSGRLEQRNWVTQEGAKRTAVEIVADEVSPSLRWAAVDVKVNARPHQVAS